jgi:hypothetical protein
MSVQEWSFMYDDGNRRNDPPKFTWWDIFVIILFAILIYNIISNKYF